MTAYVSERAKQQIQAILAYAKLQSHSTTVKNIFNDIVRAIELAARMPDAGRRQRNSEVRKVVSRKYRYLIYYQRTVGRDIQVLSVRSSAQGRELEDS